MVRRVAQIQPRRNGAEYGAGGAVLHEVHRVAHQAGNRHLQKRGVAGDLDRAFGIDFEGDAVGRGRALVVGGDFGVQVVQAGFE